MVSGCCDNSQVEVEYFGENIDIYHLMEMSVLRKHETGLTVNIWVDDGGTWKESWKAPRIYFQPDRSDHPNPHTMIPMSIEGEPEVMIENPQMSLSQFLRLTNRARLSLLLLSGL